MVRKQQAKSEDFCEKYKLEKENYIENGRSMIKTAGLMYSI